MSTLLQKVNQIKNEKDTKIIEGNLKKNVTAFGVTGTYEGEEQIYRQTLNSKHNIIGIGKYVEGDGELEGITFILQGISRINNGVTTVYLICVNTSNSTYASKQIPLNISFKDKQGNILHTTVVAPSIPGVGFTSTGIGSTTSDITTLNIDSISVNKA